MEDVEMNIFSDGGARGNPGPAGSAFVVFYKNKIIHKQKLFIGNATNNQAEYKAFLMGLNWINENINNYRVDKILFSLDSELVVKQLNNIYRVKNIIIKTYYNDILKILKKIKVDYLIKHIPREKNYFADNLVNQVIDENI